MALYVATILDTRKAPRGLLQADPTQYRKVIGSSDAIALILAHNPHYTLLASMPITDHGVNLLSDTRNSNYTVLVASHA